MGLRDKCHRRRDHIAGLPSAVSDVDDICGDAGDKGVVTGVPCQLGTHCSRTASVVCHSFKSLIVRFHVRREKRAARRRTTARSDKEQTTLNSSETADDPNVDQRQDSVGRHGDRVVDKSLFRVIYLVGE